MGETDWAAVHRMESAASTMNNAAGRAEEAAHRMACMLENGYGGNGIRLIELLETDQDALRASLTEKGREIERLKAHPVMVEHLHYMKLGDIVRLEEDLAASQAREREAVEAHLRTIDQRDAAEDALSDAFQLVTGREPEWSNLFGYADAMEEITASLGQKESALAAARKALVEVRSSLPKFRFHGLIERIDAALERINGEGHAE